MSDVRDTVREKLDALAMIRAVITSSADVGVGISKAYDADDAPQLARLLYTMSSIAAAQFLTVYAYDVRRTLAEIDRQIAQAQEQLTRAS